ncbi:MAG: nicotinate-nucleotide adenylyltransferase [Vicinamibacterales bacterium]
MAAVTGRPRPAALGLLGGTFDPIHLGHLDVARAARTALGLDHVLVVPAGRPPHRTHPRASAAHRFAMVALAVQDDAHLRLSDLEMDLTEPSFTTATLDRLEASGVDLGRLVFITGADALRDVPIWKDYPRLLDRCHFAAVSRPSYPVYRLREDLPALAGRMHDAPCALPPEPAILLVDAATAPVSSTDIRARAGAGASLVGLVPPAVADYIARNGLYGPTGVA